jgi:hypothetical protein
MADRLTPKILDILDEKIPTLSRGTIQKNISLVRRKSPSVTLNGAAQIVAQQYGKSILPQLSEKDRQSIANVQVTPVKERKRQEPGRNEVKLAGGKAINIESKKHPLVSVAEGVLYAAPLVVVAVVLLLITGEGEAARDWVIESLSRPFDRMLFSVYVVVGLVYSYFWIGSQTKKIRTPKYKSKRKQQ